MGRDVCIVWIMLLNVSGIYYEKRSFAAVLAQGYFAVTVIWCTFVCRRMGDRLRHDKTVY